jgi:hypothetical protein
LHRGEWRAYSLSAIEPLLTVCEFKADDFYGRDFGEFSYPAWWDGLVLNAINRGKFVAIFFVLLYCLFQNCFEGR